jgi:hypothetical protein
MKRVAPCPSGLAEVDPATFRMSTVDRMNATSSGAAQLTEFASGAGDQQALLAAMASRPPNARWQDLADAIMRDRLADVVPADTQHHQAARAELVNAMAHEGWNAPSADHGEASNESIQGAQAATTRIRDHYAVHSHPYPAAEPSRNAPDLPLATDSGRSASVADSEQALRTALSGQTPPRATQPTRADTAGSRPQPTAAHDPLERG